MHYIRAANGLTRGSDGILSGNAVEIINQSCLSQVVVTNSVPIGDKLERCPKLSVIDISGTLAEAIRRTHFGESVRYVSRLVKTTGLAPLTTTLATYSRMLRCSR